MENRECFLARKPPGTSSPSGVSTKHSPPPSLPTRNCPGGRCSPHGWKLLLSGNWPFWSGVAAGTRQPKAEPAQPSPCCHPSIPVPSQAAPRVGSHIPECKRPGPGTASHIASPCSRSCRGERSSRLRCGLAWVAWGGGGGTCETAQARGDSPSASIAPRCVPATPLTSEISRQSKFWNEQKEQANKTHDYEAIGFVFEAFIPVEGKDGRKDLKVLTVIEAMAKEPAKKDFPCCTLVLCVQSDGIPRSECTLIFCRNEPFPGRLTPCPCSWRFVWDVPAASTCLPRQTCTAGAETCWLQSSALLAGEHQGNPLCLERSLCHMQMLSQGEGPCGWEKV